MLHLTHIEKIALIKLIGRIVLEDELVLNETNTLERIIADLGIEVKDPGEAHDLSLKDANHIVDQIQASEKKHIRDHLLHIAETDTHIDHSALRELIESHLIH